MPTGSPYRRRMRRLGAIAVAVALTAAACASNHTGRFDAASHDPLRPEAQLYGLAPQPDPHVTFQADVVIVAGAGKSIRSVEDGGLTWHIDGRAEGADKLAVGKVMFVTGRSVGRVLALSRQGADLKVIVG